MRSAVIVGGIDMTTQAHVLFMKPRPHIVIGKSTSIGTSSPCTSSLCSDSRQVGGPFGKHQRFQLA